MKKYSMKKLILLLSVIISIFSCNQTLNSDIKIKTEGILLAAPIPRKDTTPISIKGKSNLVFKNLRINGTSGAGIFMDSCFNITIDNCEITNTVDCGIKMQGGSGITIINSDFDRNASAVYAHQMTGPLIFMYNTAKNPQGPMARGQMVQLDKCNSPGTKINCNYYQAILGQNNSEDVISFFESNGTAASPMEAINNYINGSSSSPSGGGIMNERSSYLIFKGNVLVNPGQYGIACRGSNTVIDSNKVYGKAQPFTNVGIYIWKDQTACTNNKITNNQVLWFTASGGANPFWDAKDCSGTVITGNQWQSSAVSETMPPPSCVRIPGGSTPVPPNPNPQPPYIPNGPDVICSTSQVVLVTRTYTGEVVRSSWTKVNGIAASKIDSVDLTKANFTFNTTGTSTYRLTVWNSINQSDVEDVVFTVNAAPVTNIPPVSNAGKDSTFILPDSVVLAGQASDSDGTFTIAWSGPGIIINPAQLTTTVVGLVPGVYNYVLKVTDNKGAVSVDTVVITLKMPDCPPIPSQIKKIIVTTKTEVYNDKDELVNTSTSIKEINL